MDNIKFSFLSELLAQKYPGTICGYTLDCELYGVELYDATSFVAATDCLNIFTAAQLTEAAALPLNLVCLGLPDGFYLEKLTTGTGNYIVINDTYATDALYAVMSLFSKEIKQQKLFSDISNMLLSDADMTSVFCEYSKHSGCQMLAIDISGKILAFSKPFRVDHPLWLRSVELGYLDEYLIEYILNYRIKHQMDMSTTPFMLFCDRLQLFIKAIRIISNGDILGYVFMANASGDFPFFSDMLMGHFAKNLLNRLLSSRNYNSYRYNMHQNILSDAIDSASKEETALRIHAAKLKFPANMRAIVISSCLFRGSDYLYDTLFPIITKNLPNSPKFMKNNSVVAIVECNENGEFSPEAFEILKSIAENNKIIIGASNCFHNPAQIGDYYQQALQTISSAKRFSMIYGLHFYSDHAFYVLLSNIQDKSLAEYIHPLLPKLAKHDAKNNTEFYRTLRVYAQTGFSKNKAADMIFLHRNTIKYRIQQMEQLFSVNLSDYSLLFTLMYSFYIDSFLRNEYIGIPPSSTFQEQ